MKTSNIIIIFVISTIALLSCNTLQNKSDLENLNEVKFEEAIVLFQNIMPVKSLKNGQTIEIVLTLELVSFDENVPISSEYYIDGIQYTDDGQFNDSVAGDGIYTSIQIYLVSADFLELKNSLGNAILHKGYNFKYEAELEKYLNAKFPEKASVKFGCKVRLVTCSETNWWNVCWPLPSPCTCVEFYDCYTEIEIGLPIN
jgi:hypothetical protein